MSIKINGKTIANSATPLPTQTGQAGKFLSTDGTSAKWEETGGKDQNTGKPLYDWVGTTAEYEAQKVATTHPDWLCYITDDVAGIPDTYTKNEVSSFLANKADKDFANAVPSQSFINTSIGWGMPDYSNTISNVGNNYTAIKDGYFWFCIGNANSARDIYINGFKFELVYNSYGSGGGYPILLNKGDTIYISRPDAKLVSSYFIPLKGAK